MIEPSSDIRQMALFIAQSVTALELADFDREEAITITMEMVLARMNREDE